MKRDEEEVVTKKVDNKLMNDILRKVEWKYQDRQEDKYDSRRYGVCELVENIRAAEFQATTRMVNKKKKLTIPNISRVYAGPYSYGGHTGTCLPNTLRFV